MNLKVKINLILMLVLTVVMLNSCGQKEQTLDDKKANLSKLKSQLVDLQSQIAVLEKEIALESKGKNGNDYVYVDVINVVPETFRRFINVQGTVESDRVSTLSSMFGGNVMKIYVNEGSVVQKGQLLMQIDDASIQKSKSEIETRLEYAKEVYDRQKRLWEQQAGSEMQYLQAKNNYESMSKAKETLDEQIRNTRITAPFSGYIDYIFPKVGEMLMPGMPAIKLTDMANVKIAASISESYLSSVKAGVPVQVTLSDINEVISGKIVNAARSIDIKNRTFRIEIKLDRTPTTLRPYQVCGIAINDVTKENVLTAPLANVQRSGDQIYVYTVDMSTMSAKKKTLVTGLANDSSIEIISGLKPNDKIITNGALDVTEGQKIKIVTEK